MKFISLFTKAPNYQRFNYTPRYYDARKEELKEREDRIRREMEAEKGIVSNADTVGYRGRMTGSFHTARKRSKVTYSGPNVAMLRLAILLFISLFLFAFLTWGKPVLYSLLIFVPVYFYFKFKRNIR
jgi:hypothetical protein